MTKFLRRDLPQAQLNSDIRQYRYRVRRTEFGTALSRMIGDGSVRYSTITITAGNAEQQARIASFLREIGQNDFYHIRKIDGVIRYVKTKIVNYNGNSEEGVVDKYSIQVEMRDVYLLTTADLDMLQNENDLTREVEEVWQEFTQGSVSFPLPSSSDTIAAKAGGVLNYLLLIDELEGWLDGDGEETPYGTLRPQPTATFLPPLTGTTHNSYLPAERVTVTGGFEYPVHVIDILPAGQSATLMVTGVVRSVFSVAEGWTLRLIDTATNAIIENIYDASPVDRLPEYPITNRRYKSLRARFDILESDQDRNLTVKIQTPANITPSEHSGNAPFFFALIPGAFNAVSYLSKFENEVIKYNNELMPLTVTDFN